MYHAANLFRHIRQQASLIAGDRVLVAVSGGPDSVALLHVLHELRDELALRLEVAHLQHGIRGDEAKADARFVGGLAERLGLAFHLKEIDLPELRSRAGKGNLEALARQQRYRFFADIAQRRGLNKIATAHTQDDQAETMLMWLLRGAGRKGLGGMNAAPSLDAQSDGSHCGVGVIRPFLEITKAEILEYLRHRQLEYQVDSTNRDTKLLRNWIRLELLPQLRERIDGRIVARLAGQAAMLRDEQAVLDQVAQAELEKCRRDDGLDRGILLHRPVALQRLMLRRWIEEVRGNLRGIDFAHVEALSGLAATGPAQGRLAIPGGWELRREYDLLRLVKGSRQRQSICYSYTMTPCAPLSIPEAGVAILLERLPPPVKIQPIGSMEALFDADELPEPLAVRNFRNGDRFAPLGMDGHKKVKDLFIDRKVVLSERAKLPMLIGGDQVLWIPGHGRSRVALVTRASRVVIRIKVVPLGT
jgi:tRNA(Ile)-lysidine synthase